MYDLIVFCPGKTKLFKRQPKTKIYLQKEQKYCDIWKFITLQKGMWYTLLSKKGEIGGSKICVNTDFDKTIDLPDISIIDRECSTPFAIQNQYLNDFKVVIEYLLECSSIKTVYILARYQSNDKEIVIGTYSLEKYLSLMQDGQLYSNVCYIITKHQNAIQV